MIKIYGKHIFYFSIVSILLSVITLMTGSLYLLINERIISVICLLLIISIGISHGAMDNHKARKLLENYKQNGKIIFYIIYILICFFVILLWNLFASFTLLSFLIVASYHFGREDTSFLYKGKSFIDQFFYLTKGSIIVFAPLFFHIDETLSIFEILFLNDQILFFLQNKHWIINICLSLCTLGYFYFILKNRFKDFEIFLLDLFSILILNYTFTPLIAFTIYFCFLHSVRHIISISFELNENSFWNGFAVFLKKALPLTVLTAFLYLITVVFLSNTYGLNDVITKVIFIGLASLTFPHILLEYLIETNEK